MTAPKWVGENSIGFPPIATALARTARVRRGDTMPASYARTAAGAKHLVELAEVLQCPIIDTSGRLNCPTRHSLNQSTRGRSHVAGGGRVSRERRGQRPGRVLR